MQAVLKAQINKTDRNDARGIAQMMRVGPGFGKGGTGALSVDGKEVASNTIPHTMPFLETIDETFDVGVDTRTGVDDNDYQLPFRFTGKVGKLTIKLIPLKAAEEQHLQQQIQEPKIGRSNCCRSFMKTRGPLPLLEWPATVTPTSGCA